MGKNRILKTPTYLRFSSAALLAGPSPRQRPSPLTVHVVASAIFLTQTTTSGRPQDRERLNNPKYRRALYVSSFYQHCFVFVRSYCCTHVLALLAGVAAAQGNTSLGTGALQNNTTGSQNTAIGVDALFEQHHGQPQHGQRSQCARLATPRRLQHRQRSQCAL